MSPIGRVFIVLNLALAGGFVAFAGTHLQKQHNFKEKLAATEKAAEAKEKELTGQIDRLSSDRNTLEVAKSARETELQATKLALDQSNDENKRLNGTFASMEGSIKKLESAAEAANSLAQAAHEQAKSAYAMAIADQKVKDDSVTAKNTAEAENRMLNNRVAALEATITGKDGELADLGKERNELQLLVSVAVENGFVVGLAAPTLMGEVAHVANGRLCTIKITDNPGNVDIADQLSKRKFGFALYDASGYKGEAVATAFHAADNAVTCTITLTKGEIKMGDKASTKTP